MAPPVATEEDDDARHRREQQELRAKRKAAAMSKMDSQKARKRKEHTQRILEEQRRKQQHASRSKSSSQREDGGAGESAFQGLFAKRSGGFLVDLKFRNAPPRPPVGPTFVGTGLEGELLNRWTEYRPGNAVEMNHAWKLHSEPDLGVSLGTFAMDLDGCYTVPKRARLLLAERQRQQKKKDGSSAAVIEDDDHDDGGGEAARLLESSLHPDDAALLNWKGSIGDTAAEELKVRRERARAAALAASSGVSGTPSKKSGTQIRLKKDEGPASGGKAFGGKQAGFSRVLDEKYQSWMKKTTYLTNEQYRSVHQFKSLANIKKETAEAVEKKIEEQKKKMLDPSSIENGFELANRENRNRRHPTKRNVSMVSDFPLLPDANTWGHTFTHVVLDNPPKALAGRQAPSEDQLSHAFIADVEKKEQTAGMVCNLLVPEGEGVNDKVIKYDVAQKYDLDVLPLKEEESPHVNFLLVVDEEKGVVTYHPVSSRVQLSTGRPGRRGRTTIVKRPLDQDDLKDIEMRAAEVDKDLATKYEKADKL